MTTAEITGYVQIAVGLLGIVVTVLAAPPLTSFLKRKRGDDAAHLGIEAGVRAFCVLFVLVTSTFIVALGLATTLQTVAATFGAVRPMLTSVLLITALLSLTVCLLLFLNGLPLWLPAFVGTGLVALCAVVAATSETLEGLWLIVVFGGVFLFIPTGVIALMSADENDLRAKMNDPSP